MRNDTRKLFAVYTGQVVNLGQSAEGIRFEADVVDQSKVDMSISLPLTERVCVKKRDDVHQVAYCSLPQSQKRW